MLKIAICDDENIIVNQIEDILLKIENQRCIKMEKEVFYSGEALCHAVENNADYDLIYLDIQMEKDNGITTAKKLRAMDKDFLLIFVSGFDKYWREFFQCNAFEFIQKPIDETLFEKHFLSAYHEITSRKLYFSFQYNKENYKILCSDILYFESKGRQIVIHLKDGEERVYNEKLDMTEEYLQNGSIPFLRIHQSFLVNFHCIHSYNKTTVKMSNGNVLPISNERKQTFRNDYSRLIGGSICGWCN